MIRDGLRTSSLRFMIVVLGLSSLGACLGRPSFQEARSKLADLLEPAAKEALGTYVSAADRLEESDHCGDPLTGPARGLRPTLRYTIPLADLDGDPKDLVLSAARVWQEAGLEMREDESGELFSRTATKDHFALHAYVNFENAEVTISGTGPCADDPNSD